MVFSYCKCNRHMAGNDDAAANFYNSHFIPRGWRLIYFELSECSAVHLTGYCKDCYEELEELIPLPKGLAGDDLLKGIYDTMQTVHPYDTFLPQVGYHGLCKERSDFYARRDKRSQFARSKEFLNLFHDYDRESARLWLEKNYPLQPGEVLRDTGGSLFCTAIRMARENGDFGKADAILDYILPCAHETGRKEQVELTAYEFDFEARLNWGGSEGIYIDCYLTGKFDESGRFVLPIGTIKTLKRDLEAAKIMGELCGVLTHYASQCVNQNLLRYTPEKELKNKDR